MSKLHPLRLLALACLATTAATPVLAQDSNYYYFGLSAGPSQLKTDGRAIIDGQLPAGVTSAAVSADRRDTAYRAFLGYQLTPFWALEGGYFRLGEISLASTTAPTGTLNGRLRSEGLNLDLVGSLPLNERWSVLGRVGAQYARTRGEFTGTGAATPLNPNPSGRATNYKAGLGLQYAFSPGFMMRLEAERYRVDDAMGHKGNADAVLVSVVFPFGRAPTSAPMRMSSSPYMAPAPAVAAAPAAAPSPMAMAAPMPAPAPAPMVVAVAPAPAPVTAQAPRQRVSFTAESMFGFDRSTVRPEGRSALDAFAGKLAGTQFDQITVEGHTDRLGTEGYNQQLSQRRADAVKTYLVTESKVDAGKINAMGMGEGRPVTQTADCKGNAPNDKLIACLQPDRRVDIEVTGSR